MEFSSQDGHAKPWKWRETSPGDGISQFPPTLTGECCSIWKFPKQHRFPCPSPRCGGRQRVNKRHRLLSGRRFIKRRESERGGRTGTPAHSFTRPWTQVVVGLWWSLSRHRVCYYYLSVVVVVSGGVRALIMVIQRKITRITLRNS